MKSILLTVLTVFSFSFLGGCSNNTDEAAQGATPQPAATATGEQSMDVKSPNDGNGKIPTQNPGTAGAAKAISPLTQ